jgi:hypothetical protein
VSFELRTYLLAAIGALCSVSLVTPESAGGWLLLGVLLVGNASWVADRIRARHRAEVDG